jgi:DNA-binding MarR family transcriptional regulator
MYYAINVPQRCQEENVKSMTTDVTNETKIIDKQQVEEFCPPELTGLVSFQIRLAHLAVSRVFNHYMRETGLSHVQYSALRIIAANNNITQKDLAVAAGTPQTVMVSSLVKLEKLKFITRKRSSDDRRQYFISLSKKGEQLLEKYGDLSQQAHESLLEGLTDKEVKTLMKCLQHIAEKS